MIPRCIYPQRYMVSPCGFHADFYDLGCEPEGWTDCSDMGDAEVSRLMVRRMMNHKETK